MNASPLKGMRPRKDSVPSTLSNSKRPNRNNYIMPIRNYQIEMNQTLNIEKEVQFKLEVQLSAT